MNFLAELRRRFSAALTSLDASIDTAPLVELVRSSQDPKFGDYQANCAMPLGKQLGKAPRDVAAELIAKLDLSDLCDEPEIAGPGFINLRITDQVITAALAGAAADTQHLGVPQAAEPQTIVIDYSSPNVAKPMHVGHIRSTVIGAALAAVLRFQGHRVITDNHIGDWGTQFGMIIFGRKNLPQDEAAYEREPVAYLSGLYRTVNSLIEYHSAKTKLPTSKDQLASAEADLGKLKATEPSGDKNQDKALRKKTQEVGKRVDALREEIAKLESVIDTTESDAEQKALAERLSTIGTDVLDETAKLHAGDAENLALWNEFMPHCMAEMNRVYDRLSVEFDYTLGESFYHDRLPGVVEKLAGAGLATENDGAMCVFHEEFDAPFIVQKKDGAYLYATSDLATIDYRLAEWQPDVILYVVDHRQSLHFEQLFATARKSGVTGVELHHVGFGTVMGEDGKPYKTRSGSAVGLMGLLDEAVERARLLANESPVLTADDERAVVAERIGIGAIKYADLAHNRTSDYVFSYDKMLAMTGNTAAYMQYSYARVRGIFTKADTTLTEALAGADKILLATPAERALGLAILQFAEVLDRVTEDYRPNHLTSYLFDLASRYSEFFQNCPVVKAETETLKTSRLAMCALTASVLQKGMGLLGIECVERM